MNSSPRELRANQRRSRGADCLGRIAIRLQGTANPAPLRAQRGDPQAVGSSRDIKVLSAIFDDQAVPCQTLNFIHGSQQARSPRRDPLDAVSAGLHVRRLGGAQDIHPDSGPLVVYPGSHRLPRFYTHTVGVEKVRETEVERLREPAIRRRSRSWSNTRGSSRSTTRPKPARCSSGTRTWRMAVRPARTMS